MKPIVQISLDIINIDEALRNSFDRRYGQAVDWLEAGTPLFLLKVCMA
jgi:3-keto-L-gulonate-6-phosphate decarboxylase